MGNQSNTVEELLRQYSESPPKTEKEKALLERRIWTLVDDRVNRHCYWFRERIGGKTTEYEMRQRMIGFGDWADPLWDRVEADMTMGTAMHLAQAAKKSAASEGISCKEALEREIAKYDSLENARKVNGKVVKRKRPFVIPPTEVTDDSKEFWALMESQVREFLDKRLPDVEQSVKQETMQNFVYQVRAVFDDLRRSMHVEARNAKAAAKVRIGRDRIGAACDRLGISPPRAGKPMADLDQARKRYRVLASRYHPDRNAEPGGIADPDIIKQYHAVNEAWKIIQAYQSQFGG